MKRLSLILICAFLFSISSFAKETIQPPAAKKIPKEMTIHGDTRVDPYFWLREKENPEVKAYLEAENAYTESVMKPYESLHQSLYKEMLSHVKETDLGVPTREGEYYYYSRTEQGKQYSIYCRKKGNVDAAEEIYLDMNELAKGKKYLSLGALEVSNDGNLLAYSTDNTGFREYTLQFKDLRTGQLLQDKIEKVYSVVWAGDNKTVFYTTIDHAKRPYRVFRHALGAPKDDLVYEEKDELYSLYAYSTLDKKYIIIGVGSSTTTEMHYIPADRPAENPKVILPRENEHEYYVSHHGDRFYFRTNKDAKTFKVVSAPVSDPRTSNWKEFIPNRKEVTIEGMIFFSNHAVISEREGGLQHLRVINLQNSDSHRIDAPEPVYSINIGANYVFDTSVLRFNYQSMITPSSVYDYDLQTRKRTLLKQQEVPGGFDATQYSSERIFATAKDATKVPVSLVYKKGLKRDGTAPCLLYGYGAYGSSAFVGFDSSRLVLLDRGMIYAIAHIRGGADMGQQWYEDGKMMKKMNTFTDFISVAEHLIAEKYTSPEKLAATGGSAGGLLMGAVTNLRPDLFKVILNYVPFVDVINTMLDPNIPLTVGEYLEWGNPNKKEEYAYLKAYCPYTNIAAKNYPAILVRTSFYDSQVPYWEGAKYVAKLRSMKTGENVLLLKTALEAGGHGGQSGRYDALKEKAFDYTFLLTQLGINK